MPVFGHKEQPSISFEDFERKIQADTWFHTRAMELLRYATTMPRLNKKRRDDLYSLIEELRYSDPCSTSGSNYYEELILGILEKVRDERKVLKADTDSLASLIEERNKAVRLEKCNKAYNH